MYGDTPAAYAMMHGTFPSAFKKVKDNLTEIVQDLQCTKLILTYNVMSGINDCDLEGWITYWRSKAEF